MIESQPKDSQIEILFAAPYILPNWNRHSDADLRLLYDAIIVDEGQDFEDTWWIGLSDMLKDAETGIFYIFFDDNQPIKSDTDGWRTPVSG